MGVVISHNHPYFYKFSDIKFHTVAQGFSSAKMQS